MTFTLLQTLSRATAEVKASVSYMRFQAERPGKVRKPPKLIVGVPVSIVVAAGIKPKDRKTRWAFLVGDGDDRGKARIVPHESASVTCTVMKGAGVFRFGMVPALGNSAAEKEFVDVRVLDYGKQKCIEINLPQWFNLNADPNQ